MTYMSKTFRNTALLITIAGGIALTPSACKEIKTHNAINAYENNKKVKGANIYGIDSEGNTQELSDYLNQGKPIVLNFWEKWCGFCVSELDNLDEYAANNDDVFVFAISDDNKAETFKYVKDEGYNSTIFINSSQADWKYDINAIPVTIVLDQEGNIAYRTTGITSFRNGPVVRMVDYLNKKSE